MNLFPIIVNIGILKINRMGKNVSYKEMDGF